MGKAFPLAAFLLLFAHAHAVADFAHGRDAFVEGRFQKAFRIFQSSAQTGDAKSQIGLGLMFTWGKGTTKNLFAAYQWFDRAAKSSEPVHPVVRILARTNRDYVAKRMSVPTFTDAETVAILRIMEDYAATDNDAAIGTAIIGPTAPRTRVINPLHPNSKPLTAVE